MFLCELCIKSELGQVKQLRMIGIQQEFEQNYIPCVITNVCISLSVKY